MIKISQRHRIRIKTILAITALWIIIAVLVVVYNEWIRQSQSSFEYNDYNFASVLLTNVLALMIAGPLGGFLMTYILKEKTKKLPLVAVLIVNMISFIFLIALISLLGYLIYYFIYIGPSFFEDDFWFNMSQFIKSYGFRLNLLVWTIVSTLTMMGLHVSEKYGKGVFINSILGKYHTPKVETRIFMFLDLSSSTAIAEELGHKRYFKFLNKFFDDVTRAVIESEGDVYQYVGDEVVITWPIEKGIKNNNCLHCFYDTRQIIERHARSYQRKYGVSPQFKAGLHCGEVTTGEVGTLKKDIIFTGDVMNTTSRIQSMSKELGADLLISEQLRQLLDVNDGFALDEIGRISLKGKKEPVKLFGVTPKNS
jgi:adenylate cyclase